MRLKFQHKQVAHIIMISVGLCLYIARSLYDCIARVCAPVAKTISHRTYLTTWVYYVSPESCASNKKI